MGEDFPLGVRDFGREGLGGAVEDDGDSGARTFHAPLVQRTKVADCGHDG